MLIHSTLELTVQSTTTEGRYRVIAEWSRVDELTVRRERYFELEQARFLELASTTDYGVALGQVVFVDGVRELFAEARAAAAMLRVLLAVEAKTLRSLHWERLAAPFEDDHWQLLGQSQRTPFSLHLPSGTDRRFPPFGRRELRALVVVANPVVDNDYGVEPFDEAEALDTVLEGLGVLDRALRRSLLHGLPHGGLLHPTIGGSGCTGDSEAQTGAASRL